MRPRRKGGEGVRDFMTGRVGRAGGNGCGGVDGYSGGAGGEGGDEQGERGGYAPRGGKLSIHITWSGWR